MATRYTCSSDDRLLFNTILLWGRYYSAEIQQSFAGWFLMVKLLLCFEASSTVLLPEEYWCVHINDDDTPESSLEDPLAVPHKISANRKRSELNGHKRISPSSPNNKDRKCTICATAAAFAPNILGNKPDKQENGCQESDPLWSVRKHSDANDTKAAFKSASFSSCKKLVYGLISRYCQQSNQEINSCQFRTEQNYLSEYLGDNYGPVISNNCLLDEWDTCISMM